MNPLERLLSGNARFVAQQTVATNPPALLAELSTRQSPFAAILCCSDSRVAPEIVFDQQLGSLFVCRIAGNIPTPEIIESLEYSVGFLGAKLIVVMGHSSCGVVIAALESDFPQGMFSQIALSPIPDLNESIAHNARQGVKTLLDRSPLILEAIESGDLAVASGVQDIASGTFTVLDCYQAEE